MKRLPERWLPCFGRPLWLRGLSKDKAEIDEWNKNLAPSTKLRHGFIMIRICGRSFLEKYLQELRSNYESEKFLQQHKKAGKDHAGICSKG